MKTTHSFIILLLLIIIGSLIYHHRTSDIDIPDVFCSDLASDSFPDIDEIDFEFSIDCAEQRPQPFSIDLQNRYSILGVLNVENDIIERKKELTEGDTIKINSILFGAYQSENPSWGINIKNVEYCRDPTIKDTTYHVFRIHIEPERTQDIEPFPFKDTIKVMLGDKVFSEIRGISGYETFYRKSRYCFDNPDQNKATIVPPYICQGEIVVGNQ